MNRPQRAPFLAESGINDSLVHPRDVTSIQPSQSRTPLHQAARQRRGPPSQHRSIKKTMRITVHNAENQQRFAIALTLTQKWLTTKTAADVVRLFLKRFDAKHGSVTTDEFALAVRNGDTIAQNQPLGAALGSSTDLELRRVESSDDALAQLRKLETMEEAAISKAYRALARGAGDGLSAGLIKGRRDHARRRATNFSGGRFKVGPRARGLPQQRVCQGAQRQKRMPTAPLTLTRRSGNLGTARCFNSGAVVVETAARRR